METVEGLGIHDAITNLLDYNKLSDQLSAYNKLRENLSVVDGVPMYGIRLIIPRNLRQKIFESLHSAQECPVKMNDRAIVKIFTLKTPTLIIKEYISTRFKEERDPYKGTGSEIYIIKKVTRRGLSDP